MAKEKTIQLDPRRLANKIVDTFLKEKTHRNSREITWQDCLNYYQRVNPKKVDTWESQDMPSEGFEVIENSTDLISNTLFNASRFLDLESGNELLQPHIEALQKDFNNSLEKSRFVPTFGLFLKQLATLGTAVLYTQSNNVIRPVDINDFVFSPSKVTTIDEAEIFIYRWNASVNWVKANPQFNENRHNVQALTFGSDDLKNWKDRQQTNKDDICELLLAYCTSITIDDNTFNNVICVIANRSQVLYVSNSPKNINPFTTCCWKSDPFSPYGQGVIEPILPQLSQLYTLQNSLLDEVRLSVHGIMLANSNDQALDLNYLKSGITPGMVIPASQANALSYLVRNNPQLRDVYQIIQSLKAEINEITGIQKAITVNGGGARLANTATEASILASQGETSFIQTAKHINQQALIPCLRKLLYLFVSQSEEYKPLLPHLNDLDFKVIALGSLLEKRDKIVNIEKFTSTIAQTPMAQALNWPAISEKYGQLVLGEDWDEKFLLQQLIAPPADAPPANVIPPQQ